MNIGLDIGGTKIIAAYRDPTGQLVVTDKIATPRTQAKAIEAISELITHLAGTQDIATLAISAPGPADFHQGILLNPQNLGWGDVALVDRLSQNFPHTKIFLENDANTHTPAWKY